MATVYSLICWGGKDGKATTSIDSSADTLTISNHGLRDGTGLVPQSSVNGLTSGTTYYARSTGTNTFTLHTSAADAIANTGLVDLTGTTNLTFKSAYYVGLTDKSRWTYDGTEYIYARMVDWNSAATARQSFLNSEYCEIGEAFDDINTGYITIFPLCADVKIYPINNAGHNGVINSGYRFISSQGNYTIGSFRVGSSYSGSVVSCEGFTVINTSNGKGLTIEGVNCSADKMIVISMGSTSSTGLSLATGTKCTNTLVLGWYYGFNAGNYSQARLLANCTFTKNEYGFYTSSTTNVLGKYWNNVSFGNNTLNWGPQPTGMDGCGGNAGESGDTVWVTGSYPTYTVSTSDFVNYGTAGVVADTDDFHPISTSSLVDNAVYYIEQSDSDIAGDERPNYDPATYPNGVRDIGAFEYNSGNGVTPQSQEVTVSGFSSGSRISINKTDGTEIYNTDSPSWPQTTNYTTVTPVYIYIRKGSASTYYHPLKLAAQIDPESGLTYDATGLQVEDIAATTPSAGVQTDWAINWDTGAITHSSGTTRYTVQDLYSYHQDESDTSTNIVKLPKMKGTTPRIFEMINDGDISDADLEDLTGGSIEFQDGTLWSNLWTTDTMAAAHPVYIVQGTSKYTSFWADGPIDVLLKVSDGAVLRSSGVVTAYARAYGYTFAHYEVDLSGGGRSVAPLGTLEEPTCQAISAATVATYTDVTYGVGGSYDLGEGGGAGTYDIVLDCAGRTLDQVFARTMYDCRADSTTTINSVPGWRYQKANASYDANVATPFGTYSGGFWTVAQGVWLANVAGSDTYNYSVTDAAGVTHQLTQPAGAATATVLDGTRVVLYNTTTDTEIDNTYVSGTTAYSYTITTEATTNDVLTLFAFKEGYEESSANMIWSGLTQAFVISQSIHPYVDALRTELSISDYTTITEFAPDTTGHVYIESNDPDGNSQKARAAIWYNGILTTEGGARYFRGGMTILSTAAFRINTDAVDLLFENVNPTTALTFTDLTRRLYRDDGTSIIAPTSYSIHNDYNGVPDVVETGVSGLTGPESAQLMALPSATAVTTAIFSQAQTTPIQADTQARVVEGALTEGAVTRIMLAALAGKRAGLGTATETYMAQDGVTPRITLTPDASGNGTPVLDGS